jgi:hypothetical protein
MAAIYIETTKSHQKKEENKWNEKFAIYWTLKSQTVKSIQNGAEVNHQI